MNRKNTAILLAINAAGAILMGLIVSAAIILIVFPLVQRGVNLPAMQRALDAASQRSTALMKTNVETEALITKAIQRQQEELGRAVFDETGIAGLVASTCAEIEVNLQFVEPLRTVAADKAISHHDVRVRGRGEFPRLYHVLATLEAASPFLEIRDVQIFAGASTTECEFSWIVRCRRSVPQPQAAESST
ncbi:MAG: GspMb/PilO family protein [Phycisphaerae bacterium]